MTRTFTYFISLCILAGMAWSCTQPVTIGSDFLDDEIPYAFSDDFTFTIHTEKTDSVLTHFISDAANFQLITNLLGNLQDPIFGVSSAEMYIQPVLPAVGYDLIGSTIDSVSLLLRYDTLGLYGDLTAPVTIEVYQMLETPVLRSEYYSNDSFQVSNELLGSVTFVPSPRDSVEIINPEDTIRVAPHINIPLLASRFNDLLLQDSIVFQHQDSFLNYFHGLYIKMTGATNTMLGINLLNSLSGMVFYYDAISGDDHVFKMLFTNMSVKHVHMEHNYTGTVVESALGPDPEEAYWYIQGMSGVTSSMTIGGLEKLENKVINEADLEVFVTFPDGDNEGLYPPPPYIVAQEQTDTSLNYSIDARIALGVSSGNHYAEAYKLLFDGSVGEREPGPPVVYRYNMKVTNQVKDIVREKSENIIYFNPFSKADFPHRAVLFGPNHPTYAPRLRVYYTDL